MKTLKQILKEDEKRSELHKKLSNLHNNLNFDEKYSLGDYSGSGSKRINNHLWFEKTGKHINSFREKMYDEEKDYIKSHIGPIDSAISKNKAPHDLHIYSGTPHDPRKIKNANGVVHHPSYLSTSLNPHIAHTFADDNREYKDNLDNREIHNHIMEIHVPKNHPGVYNSQPGVGISAEREYILPRGSNLKYHGTDTEVIKNDHGDTIHRHTHHMSVLPHKLPD
jgi:hypothetical protein